MKLILSRKELQRNQNVMFILNFRQNIKLKNNTQTFLLKFYKKEIL